MIDATNPANPQLRDSLNPEGTENWDPYVPVPLSYGYLASDYGGLVTIDLHDPNSIFEASSGCKAGASVDVEVDDGRAYVANRQSGLQIVDITDPTAPVSLGIFDTVGAKVTYTATARDSFAYVGTSGITGRRFLRVLDVLDPTNPTLVAQESCFNPPQDMVIRDSFIYVAEMNRFQVFNVARPREPVLVGSCVLPGDVWDLDVEDTLAYITSTSLVVVSIAQPSHPYIIANWQTMVALDAVDTILYTLGSGKVWSVNMVRPTAPVVLDTLPIASWVSDIAVDGPLAYAGGVALHVIDVGDPHALRERGVWTPPHEFRRLVPAGPYVYAACYEAGVCILETIPTGIAEPKLVEGKRARKGASVVRGVLFLPEARGERREARSELRDISGRKVAALHPGANDVRALAPGVYFVREQSVVSSQHSGTENGVRCAVHVRKVVITR